MLARPAGDVTAQVRSSPMRCQRAQERIPIRNFAHRKRRSPLAAVTDATTSAPRGTFRVAGCVGWLTLGAAP